MVYCLGGFKKACGAPHRRNFIFPMFLKVQKSNISQNIFKIFLNIYMYFNYFQISFLIFFKFFFVF